ncbi:hypothetical protein [Nonomuraea recticatena]|uniref:hypothetical protein n=1 Tax=Nonomuraea recticatena TaxID=46178 RepID=UPI0036094575
MDRKWTFFPAAAVTAAVSAVAVPVIADAGAAVIVMASRAVAVSVRGLREDVIMAG